MELTDLGAFILVYALLIIRVDRILTLSSTHISRQQRPGKHCSSLRPRIFHPRKRQSCKKSRMNIVFLHRRSNQRMKSCLTC